MPQQNRNPIQDICPKEFRMGIKKETGGRNMIATHIVKVSYFVSTENDMNKIRMDELLKWKLKLGDALEQVEVEKL
jgi:hypothetical protein